MENRAPDNRLQSFFLKVVRESFWQPGYLRCHGWLDTWPMFSRSSPRADSLYKFRGRAGAKEDGGGRNTGASACGFRPTNAMFSGERSLRKYVWRLCIVHGAVFSETTSNGKGSLDYYIQEAAVRTGPVSDTGSFALSAPAILYPNSRRSSNTIPAPFDYTRKAASRPPGEDPFCWFVRQVEGWIKVNVTEN